MYKSVYKYDDMKREEHMAVRTTAGWYFWTHQLLEVTGEDAAAFLDWLFPNPISNLKPGKERYTTMLDENAEIIDDVVVIRLEEQKFWVSTLFIHYMIRWFDTHKGNYQVEYKDITKQYQMYAVQGPRSLELVNAVVDTPVDHLKFFTMEDNTFGGIPVKVNRAGFTGEKFGYEIYIAADKAELLEDKLKETAPKYGAKQVTEFQIMAWTLPTEAGFYYMRDLRHCNPFEVGLEKGINWDKDFIGKEALLKIREAGPAREMVGFTMQEADVHLNPKSVGGPGNPVLLNGEEVGRLSKFNYSYVKEISIGYILAQKGALRPGDVVQLKSYGTVKSYDAVITEKVFI